MRFLIITLLIFIAAVWAGIKIAADPGYALFAYQHWTVQMPLWIAAAIILLSFVLLHNLLLLVRGTGALAKKIRRWNKQRRFTSAQRLTKKGLQELAEGKWASAEALLVKATHHDNTPLINYLAAARAAQEQGADDRRDEYLRRAHESTPGSAIAIGLTQAQLQFSHKQLEHSLATLRHLQHIDPQNVYVLKMLKKLYVELGDWNGIIELLPELRKRKVLNSDALTALEQQAYIKLLQSVANNPNHTVLDEIWRQMPRSLRRDNTVILPYTQALLAQHREQEAEAIIQEALKSNWSAELVSLYGLLPAGNEAKQLDIAEGWQKQYGTNPTLLLTLGRLCMRNRLWGQARQYLESACDTTTPSVEVYAELARLLEHVGDTQQAMVYYRKGLLAATATVPF